MSLTFNKFSYFKSGSTCALYLLLVITRIPRFWNLVILFALNPQFVVFVHACVCIRCVRERDPTNKQTATETEIEH